MCIRDRPATDAPAENTATDVTETPNVVNSEAEASAAEGEATKVAHDPEQMRERMQRRIDRKHAAAATAMAENAYLKQQLDELRGTGKTEQKQETADPVALAREMSRIERFTEKANSLVAEGSKKHANYMGALKDLAAEVGDFVKPNGAPSPFMEVVLEVAEKPSALLYHLGKNPDLASELADLSPIQLAKRLDRIERDLDAKPKTSNAPKPLEPVKGTATDSDLGSGLSDTEWLRRREAQLKERRGR
jgi:hypothetical protein